MHILAIADIRSAMAFFDFNICCYREKKLIWSTRYGLTFCRGTVILLYTKYIWRTHGYDFIKSTCKNQFGT